MNQKEFEQHLSDAEARLERLRAMYEQYFQGVERVPPADFRKQFENLMRELMRSPPRNTALRFRLQTMRQRFVTLSTYWDRVVRQIEEGTYYRDVQRMKMRQQRRQGPGARDGQPRDLGIEVDVDLDEMDFDAEISAALGALEAPAPPPRPAPPSVPSPGEKTRSPSISPFGLPAASERPAASAVFARPASGAPAAFRPPTGATPPSVTPVPSPTAIASPPVPPRRPPPAGVSDEVRRAAGLPPAGKPPPLPPVARPAAPRPEAEDQRLRRIYDDYVAARRKNNERVDNVKFETVKKSIEQMMPKLREKHAGKTIDFQVVVKDGRVGLKPVPKD